MKTRDDLIYQRRPVSTTAFQVYHRNLLALLDDAQVHLPEAQWNDLAAIIETRLARGRSPERDRGEARDA